MQTSSEHCSRRSGLSDRRKRSENVGIEFAANVGVVTTTNVVVFTTTTATNVDSFHEQQQRSATGFVFFSCSGCQHEVCSCHGGCFFDLGLGRPLEDVDHRWAETHQRLNSCNSCRIKVKISFQIEKSKKIFKRIIFYEQIHLVKQLSTSNELLQIIIKHL